MKNKIRIVYSPAETLAETLVKYSRNIPKETQKERWNDGCMFVFEVYSKVFPEVLAEVSAESKYSIGCLVVYFILGEWRIKYK